MKIKLLLVSLAVAGSTYAQVGPADLSVGFGSSLEGEATFQAPFITTNGPEANYSQSIEVEGYDITFTLGIEAANASLITGDGTNGLVNVRSDVEIALFGGNDNRWLDARSAGSADDESLKLTLSASGSGVSNLTSVALESAEIRRFGLINGSSNEVAWTDGSATYSTNNSTGSFSGFFSYNNTSTNLNHYELTGLTPLSTNNVGGIGDDSWNLALSASDASGTLSSFTLGGIKVNFALNTYTNEAPVADSQSVEVEKNSSLPITLTATDKEMDAVVYSILDAPTSGTLNTNMGSNVIYTPNTDYTGLDSFTFVVEDADSASTGTVSVTVLEPTGLITGESVHDFSSQHLAVYTATNMVNESGLTFQSDDVWYHDADEEDVTYNAGLTNAAWLEFDLGEVTTLTEIHLWNGNDAVARRRDRGAKTIDVYVSNTPGTAGNNTADGTWGTKIATITPAMGPGLNTYAGERFNITDTEGRYVRLDITENWGDAYTALNEVHFYATPEPPQTAYELWEEEYGLQEGVEGDDDKDNVSNLAEYAINGNPTNAADTGQTGISNDGSTFTYVHAKHATDNSLVYRLIDTTDLVNGTPGTNGYVSQVDGPVDGDYLMVTNNYDMTGKPVQFVELEVEQ